MEPFFIPIILFLCIAAVMIVWLTVRYRERIAMVEKGLGSDEIKAIYTRTVKRDPLSSLKWGILFVLGGIGVILSSILSAYLDIEEHGGLIGMVIVFIGAGLLLFYRIASKKPADQ